MFGWSVLQRDVWLEVICNRVPDISGLDTPAGGDALLRDSQSNSIHTKLNPYNYRFDRLLIFTESTKLI